MDILSKLAFLVTGFAMKYLLSFSTLAFSLLLRAKLGLRSGPFSFSAYIMFFFRRVAYYVPRLTLDFIFKARL